MLSRHNNETELFCLACNENTGHIIDYLDGRIKMITCSSCGFRYELIIEINLSQYPKQLFYRLRTKPERMLSETNKDLAKFVRSFPVRVVTKPYRLLSELVNEVAMPDVGRKAVNTDLFCCICNESTNHKIYYYKDVLHSSKCVVCGFKIEFVSIVINVHNYPEEILQRVITKPDRILKEISMQGSGFFNAIPVRVITKPYRICRELLDKLLKSRWMNK
jgi:hypothetical protein